MQGSLIVQVLSIRIPLNTYKASKGSNRRPPIGSGRSD